MLKVFYTVRFKMLSVLIVVLLGFFLLAVFSYISDRKLIRLNDYLSSLQESHGQLERLKGLIEESNRLLTFVVFQNKQALSAQLLAINEDILNQFESFRNDAYVKHLDEDYHFAIENEPLILSLRRDYYRIVIDVRRGRQKKSQEKLFKLLNHRVKPILGFIKNAGILRDLHIKDVRTNLNSIRYQIARNTIIFYGAIAFIVLITILFISRSITWPLILLLNTVRKISNEKDFSLRARVNSSDEIGVLSHSFNDMLEQLETSKKHTDEINWHLNKSAETLAQEAEEREQLIQQLEDKNTELEQYTYTVSHDLKSPLVTIKGFVGLLKQDIKDTRTEQINSDLEQIASAADKMAFLLDDLLELSRIGRVVNRPTEILLSELFEEVLTVIHGQIEESKAIIDIQANMPSVFADKSRMFEVAQNLLDNAIKFRQKNSAPVIFVTATINGNNVVCCVSDNGIGIHPDYHTRIFGLFNRLNSSFEGTGIGLTLVKRIVEVHNGQINVESKGEGQGTKFYITLPIYRATKQ